MYDSHVVNKQFDIISAIPSVEGWQPIAHMANLAADLLGAGFIELSDRVSSLNLIRAIIRGRSRYSAKKSALIIVPEASFLSWFISNKELLDSYNRIAVWIIDSFNTDRMSRRYSLSRFFDYLYITNGYDEDEYRKRTGLETQVLSWGSDVLNKGGAPESREFDLLRVGRQPDEWDDDKNTRKYCEQLGIKYCGRPPPSVASKSDAMSHLMDRFYKRSKLLTAHSNLVDSTHYTHSRKEYITGRWTDALACGCSVVGVPPTTDYIYQNFLWPEALLELSTTDIDLGLKQINSYLVDWTPAIAKTNYLKSLEHLDWRWRFKAIAKLFELDCPKLDFELKQIEKLTLENK